MSAPSKIRSTGGFRNLNLWELNANGLPIGAKVLEPYTPFGVSAGVLQSTPGTLVPAGTAVDGGVGYYGVRHSGAKVLTITDPVPRVLAHVGDDSIINYQVLPPIEVLSGELRTDKTNDIVDAIIGNLKSSSVGEANIQGVITNQRGYELTVAALAYSAAQDSDPNSTNFGIPGWDFRIFPKVIIFQREPGYSAEANERMYSFTPLFATAHIWGKAFSLADDGYTRGQIIRGNSYYKPVIVSFLGDGTTEVFPFDYNRPAQSAGKVAVYVNGVLTTSGVTATEEGLTFTSAPALGDVIVVWYETAAGV
jgi:hypothetical protein